MEAQLGGRASEVVVARSLAQGEIVAHRPKLDSRKKVADYLRAVIAADTADSLRAIFVDEEGRFCGLETVEMPAPRAQRALAVQLIESTFCAGASALILIGGRIRPALTISSEERQLVADLDRLADGIDIHLLDFVVIHRNVIKGVKALHDRERI